MKPKPTPVSSLSRSSCNGHELGGCIFKILRRILCFSSLSSRPFNHIQENERESCLEIGGSDNVGIVARLMGLNSLPESLSSPYMKSRGTIPAYEELEDENFFILSFENCGKSRKMNNLRTRRRKTKNLKERNKENEDLNMDSKGSLDLDSCIRKKSDFDKVEIDSRKVLFPLENSCQKLEDDSENSSPNSVLEFVDFSNDQETASSGEKSRLSNSKLRRTLSEELNNCEKSKEKSSFNNGYGEQNKLILRNKHHNYAEILDQIRCLAAKEIMKSRWVNDEISKNQLFSREIGRDLASDILDLLLDELLANLT